jgi:hypothetical protein
MNVLEVIRFDKFDELVISPKMLFSVIPAKAGIQYLQAVANCLDSGLRRNDDFLRSYQVSPPRPQA